MEEYKKQIIDTLKDETNIPPEGLKYFCAMLDWVLSIIKQDMESNNDVLSSDGLITYFDFDNVRYNLGIRQSSSFYSYSEFYICILQLVIKGLYAKGFNIDVDSIDDPVRRFKMTIHKINKLTPITNEILENTNIMREFSAICEVVKVEDGEYNIESILEMCKCTDKLQKYDWNTEAVSKALQFMQHKNEKREEVVELKTETVKDVKIKRKVTGSKHYSKKYKVDVIHMWIKEWSFEFKHLQDGLYPPDGAIIKVIAPRMKELLYNGKYEADVKLVESKTPPLTEDELLSNLRQRFISWVSYFNRQCVEAGLEAPFKPKNKYVTKKSIEEVLKYGSRAKYIKAKLDEVNQNVVEDTSVETTVNNETVAKEIPVEEVVSDNTPKVNIPFVQIPEEVTTSVEYTTTVAEAEIHTYNVTFKYKFNGLFNRYRDFSQKINGFTEGDAYCKVLPVFYKDKSFKDVKIKSSSIIVTQMD